MARHVQLSLDDGDITEFAADVVVLKHAQKFHGGDAAVMTRLVAKGVAEPDGLSPAVGEQRLVASNGAIAAPQTLWLGTKRIWSIGYAGVLAIGARALPALRGADIAVRHVAVTTHGPGFGLDEVEASLSLVAGLKSAIVNGMIPDGLERVSIVEHNMRRATNIRRALRKHLKDDAAVTKSGPDTFLIAVGAGGPLLAAVGPPEPERKQAPHAFVAMPFVKEMDDVFYYGIQGPVQRWGRLCERVDQAIFTGDILSRILSRIESADVVIADLTGQNPNVYLEVGYAWARERPTVLLIQDVAELRFDVQGQRCIIYDSIRDLESKLAAELRHVAPER
jgi:hypothetical protein